MKFLGLYKLDNLVNLYFNNFYTILKKLLL